MAGLERTLVPVERGLWQAAAQVEAEWCMLLSKGGGHLAGLGVWTGWEILAGLTVRAEVQKVERVIHAKKPRARLSLADPPLLPFSPAIPDQLTRPSCSAVRPSLTNPLTSLSLQVCGAFTRQPIVMPCAHLACLDCTAQHRKECPLPSCR